MREPPPDNGSVRTGADQGAVVAAEPDTGDAATVSHSHVCYHTLLIVPHFHQFVVSSCHKKGGEDPT